MNPTPDTTAGSGGAFDPREAAALLNQTSREARRQFEPAQPWLLSIRAVLVLAALGAVWLSVRGQHPYQGPGSSDLLIVAAFVVMAGLGVTRDSQSGYLLTVPLIVVGVVYAALMAVRSDWREFGVGLAVAATGAVGASIGQAGAWAVVGVGLCITLLGSAAAVAWQLHRA
jgi:hypothetical protein